MSISSVSLDLSSLDGSTRAWRYGAEHGPTLVMVHGFRGDHHGLEGLATELVSRAPELRVIVPDLPGFGESPAIAGEIHNLDLYGRWLCALTGAKEVATSRFAILGHSFGSLVVANALSQGLSPANITLINPISAPALEGPKAILTKLAILYYKVADLLPESAAHELLGNRFIVRVMSEVMAKSHDKQLRAFIHDQHDRYFSRFSDSTTLLQAFRASVSHTVTDYADSFSAPTLLIAGDQDDITPLHEQLSLSHRIPRATLRVVTGVGHLVHYEAVDFAVSEMLNFLRTESHA